jgi:hypothetical protein
MVKDRLTIVKESNPKDAVGIKKVPFSTLSAPVVMEMAIAMLEGALKYGRHNYRVKGVRASVYYDALMRHITAWWEGEDIDAESGMHHLVKAMTTLLVLRDAMVRHKWVDDRPPGTVGFISHLNQLAAKLIERFPEPKDAFIAREGEPPDTYDPSGRTQVKSADQWKKTKQATKKSLAQPKSPKSTSRAKTTSVSLRLKSLTEKAKAKRSRSKGQSTPASLATVTSSLDRPTTIRSTTSGK